MNKDALLKRIDAHEARIAVIGMGYVGLPLAVEFANEGYEVIGIDVAEGKVEMLNAGQSYIPDVPTELVKELVDKGLLKATTDYSTVAEVDAISICVPTPLRKTKDPDMSYIIASTNEIVKHATPGTLLVLESTTYPGTTDELIIPQFEEAGFTIGEDIFVCFSPERIDPGNEVYGVRNTPKIIGGATPACIELSTALYGKIIDTVVPVSSTRAAEMVKLLENTFRAVNIGLVNEIALMCDKLDVNVWEVINAASTKPYGFMTHYPGPGLGGHCIPIDPLYLSWKMKTLNYNARFIELATEVNGNMPLYVVEKVIDALNTVRKPVNGSQILVLGVAYKPNINDSRESPAIDIIGLLQERGGEVIYHDPYIASMAHEGINLESVDLTQDTIENADCVVIVTNHTTFDYTWIGQHADIIVDSRNAMADITETQATVIGL